MKTRLFLLIVMLLMTASAWSGDNVRISGYWKIKVDETHYAKAAANLTQWSTEISVQTDYDLFQIEGTYDACTIKLMGRSNNIGPDRNMQLFVDQTAST